MAQSPPRVPSLGNLTSRFRWLAAVHVLWGVLCCVLSLWWGSLIYSKSKQIVALQAEVRSLKLSQGGAPDKTSPGEGQLSELARTRRMLWWEGGTFVTFVIVGSIFLLWLDRRDARRAKAIQAFFASVTHELRTPLTSIRLQAESIADALSQPQLQAAETTQLIERLLEDTTRLQSQVEQALELARVEGGGRVFNEPISLRVQLERLRKQWKTERTTRNYPLTIESDFSSETDGHAAESEADATVYADKAALQIILRNLLENSLKHAQSPNLALRFRLRPQGEWVALEFSDNGKGPQLDSQRLGKIFEKGPQSNGTGVGLYLVRQLMGRMNGRLEFGNPTAGNSEGGFRATLWFRKAPQE